MILFQQITLDEHEIERIDNPELTAALAGQHKATILIPTGEHFEAQDKFAQIINDPIKAKPYSGKTVVLYGEAGGKPKRVNEITQYELVELV